LLFDDDIPFSHNVHTVHFFPSGGERGQEDKLKVLISILILIYTVKCFTYMQAANEELITIGIKVRQGECIEYTCTECYIRITIYILTVLSEHYIISLQLTSILLLLTTMKSFTITV